MKKHGYVCVNCFTSKLKIQSFFNTNLPKLVKNDALIPVNPEKSAWFLFYTPLSTLNDVEGQLSNVSIENFVLEQLKKGKSLEDLMKYAMAKDDNKLLMFIGNKF